MTLLDYAIRVIGRHGHPDLPMLKAAEQAAAALYPSKTGIFYEGESRSDRTTHGAIQDMAREQHPDVDMAHRLLQTAGSVSGRNGAPEFVSDLVHEYCWPHVESAYYLGLAIGWDAARSSFRASADADERPAEPEM